MISHLHLLRPWWLLMLLPLAAVIWRLSFFQSRSNTWRKVCDPGLLNYLLVRKTQKSRRLALYLLPLAWFITILALSGPTWSRIPQTVYRSVHGEVIVFDLSPNMLASDVKPSRLTRAKYKLVDLLRQVQNNSVGLVAFGGEAYTVSPLTQDAHTISAMVPEMSPNIMPTIGSNIAAGLQQGAKLLKQGGATPGSIILITGSNANAAAISEAKKLVAQGIKIDVLGIGSEAGSPIRLQQGGFLKTKSGNLDIAKLNIASLQHLAAASGGEYVPFSNTNQDITQLVHLNDIGGKQAVKSGVAKSAWKDQGRWLLILLILLALLLFRRGWFEEITL